MPSYSGSTSPSATDTVTRFRKVHSSPQDNPFLEHAFTTLEWRIEVAFHADGTWSYDQDTVMQIQGQAEPFHHTDRNTLTKVGEPSPNPLEAGRGN